MRERTELTQLLLRPEAVPPLVIYLFLNAVLNQGK